MFTRILQNLLWAQLLAVQRLLAKLALECDRHLLPGVHHALSRMYHAQQQRRCKPYPGNGPLPVVLALNRHKLEDRLAPAQADVAVRITLPSATHQRKNITIRNDAPRDNRVRGVVGPVAPQQSTSSQSSAAARVPGLQSGQTSVQHETSTWAGTWRRRWCSGPRRTRGSPCRQCRGT